MNIEGKEVLITGACGFIGSHLFEALINMGCKVTAFTFYNSFGKHGWLDSINHISGVFAKNYKIVSGDVRDFGFVLEVMKNIDVVFHLAALIGIPYSYLAPESYIDTNVKGSLNILNAARIHDVEKVIITSTSETYGTAQYTPIDEKHIANAQSPYAASKVAADQLSLSYYASFNLPVAIIRPFNTFGPRQSIRAVIPTIITQLAEGQKKIHLGSLTPTRDFNFVKDTVNGFLQVAASDRTIGEVINIGSGRKISVGDTVRMIMDLMNSKAEIISEEQRVGVRAPG